MEKAVTTESAPVSESLAFRVQGSDVTPYTVTFTRCADTLSATCDCLAGRAGKGSCKHRLRILEGSIEGITCGNQSVASQVTEWLRHCQRGAGLLRAETTFSKAEPRRVAKAVGVVFTGFDQASRKLLEADADAAGLRVCKSVDKACLYLVAGPNAGPAKLAKARAQGATVINEEAFSTMIRTGELPEG